MEMPEVYLVVLTLTVSLPLKSIRDTYIILCDIKRETPQHNSLALLLLLHFVVLVWIIPIIFIIESVTIASFLAPLLLRKKQKQSCYY